MDSPFKVDVASTWDSVAARWSRIEKDGAASPFQSARWQSIWYDVFGQPGQIDPVIVTVFDQRCGRDILLLPLIRRQQRSMRIIEFSDLWVTDCNAPLIGAGCPLTAVHFSELWKQVLQALPDADLISLAKMPARANGFINPLTLLEAAHRSTYTGHAVTLPDNWEDYPKSLKKDVRTLLKRRWQRFCESGNTGFRLVESPAEGLRVFETLQAQQTARLASRGERHVFEEPRYVSFYSRVIAEGISDGSAILATLVAEGEVVACLLAIVNGQHCTVIRTSLTANRKWTSLGLGKLIIQRSMQVMHERGIRCFDLSIGDYSYKHDFQVTPAPLFDLDIAQTWRGSSWLCRNRAWTQLKDYPYVATAARSLKRVLSPRAASL